MTGVRGCHLDRRDGSSMSVSCGSGSGIMGRRRQVGAWLAPPQTIHFTRPWAPLASLPGAVFRGLHIVDRGWVGSDSQCSDPERCMDPR